MKQEVKLDPINKEIDFSLTYKVKYETAEERNVALDNIEAISELFPKESECTEK